MPSLALNGKLNHATICFQTQSQDKLVSTTFIISSNTTMPK